MTEEEIQSLLEQNLALARETRDLALKTHNFIKWVRIMDIVKVALVVIPLVAAALYLPSLVDLFSAGYGDILPSGILR